jgi:hypothetical protein
MILNKVTDFYKRFEKYISPISLISGSFFTFITLKRVDAFIENFWIVMNLLLVAFGIIAITFYENRSKLKNISLEDRQKFNFYLTLIIQFAFGGLFSTFFVFYIRSSSVADSWFFLFIILILLIGNELWKKHYERLAFQVSIFFISLYLFFVFLLPVLFHRLGADLFLASGILSLIIIILFLLFIKKFALEKFKSHHKYLRISIITIFVAMNVMYFTNIIPPIPLSLKEAGAYHNITKITADNGSLINYKALGEPTVWQDYFRTPIFHKEERGAVFVFSSIFSPVKFATSIVHQWQYYDEVEREWLDSSKIILPISGGREEGFRTYSLKNGVTAGLWRVKVTTVSGQVLGKINFVVENATTSPDLISKNL